MRIEILTVSRDVLGGAEDPTYPRLAGLLAGAGLCPIWHTVLSGEREELSSVLRIALARADGVVTVGGLGAPPDDGVRRVLSQVLGRRLIFEEAAWREMNALAEPGLAIDGPGAPSARSNGVVASAALTVPSMALVPRGARVIESPPGVAPGLFLQTARGFVSAFPFHPKGAARQMERFLLPLLGRRSTVGGSDRRGGAVEGAKLADPRATGAAP